MADLDPITRTETFLAGNEPDLTPITREEVILAGGDLTPVTRKEWFLKKYRGGGGSSVTVEPLTVTQNGTQTAPSGKAYSPVTVNVPQPSGTKNITISQNGTTTENVTNYASASISINVHPAKILDRNGKLANIFGTQNEFNTINSLLVSGDIFAFVSYEFSGTPVSMALMPVNSTNIQGMAFNSDGTMANTMGVMIGWNTAGNVTAIALMGGQLQDLSSYAPLIDANLVVYGTTGLTQAT